MRTSSDLGLQVLVDLAEDRRDRRAEHAQDAHSSDGDERQDERVLHHCLTLFAIAKGREREVCPHRDQLRPLHLVPPFGLPTACVRRRTGEFRSIPPLNSWRIWTDRPRAGDRLPLEGWVSQAVRPDRVGTPATREPIRTLLYRSWLISLKIDETDVPSTLRMPTAATETSARMSA